LLKKRIIAVLILKNGWVVQSIGFSRYLPVGSLDVSIEYLNKWGIDEIVILDIDSTNKGQKPNFQKIKQASKFSQAPLTIGGGIKSTNDMIEMIKSGADKIVINTEFLRRPTVLTEGAKYFGNQCVVASIDIEKTTTGDYRVFNRNENCSKTKFFDLVKQAEDQGAGEIFINAVHRDGMKNGYDLNLFSEVKDLVKVPIIFCGGVGNVGHIIEGATAGIDALAVGNFFHFTEMSVILSKEIMSRQNISVRQDTYASYKQTGYDPQSYRLCKADEAVLEGMRFEKIEEEII